MKKILWTVFVLSILPIVSFSQVKGDNTIILNTSISSNQLKKILFELGYMQENNDSSFITTTAKPMRTGSVLRLLIAKTDTSLIIKGQRKMLVEVDLFGTGMPLKEEFEPVSYVTSRIKTMPGEWWNQLVLFADKIGGTKQFIKQ